MKAITAPSGKVAHRNATSTKRNHISSLARIQRYENNAVTARIMQELKVSQKEAETLFKETLKFLWLAGKFGSVVPSPRIDEAWHTFILFTMDYQKFCHKFFGFFLHHRPRRPEDKPDGGKLRNRTHALIAEHLGDNLGEDWNYQKLAKGDCEQSCAPSRDCNGGGNVRGTKAKASACFNKCCDNNDCSDDR